MNFVCQKVKIFQFFFIGQTFCEARFLSYPSNSVFVLSQQLILTRWRPLNEPLVNSWMAAGNQSNGWEMQSGSDTCQENILRSGSVMQRLQAVSGKGALPAAGR